MERADVRQFDRVSAVFSPQRIDDLKPEAAAMLGRRFVWSADWVIDEGFAYSGDWHMTLSRGDWLRTGVVWAPLCDLVDLERVQEGD